MDIITHAWVGFVTGSSVGQPLVGTLAGIAPDLVMGVQRQKTPPPAYTLSHSAIFTLLVTYVSGLLFGKQVALATFLALVSHLYLDFFTHGPIWGSPILYPFSKRRFSPLGEEWEFFNEVWWVGLFLAVCWCFIFVCVLAP